MMSLLNFSEFVELGLYLGSFAFGGVFAVVGVHQIISKLKNLNLYTASRRASYLKIGNQNYLRAQISSKLQTKQLRADRFALVILGVDFLQSINSQNGHDVGNEIEVETAKAIHKITRHLDVVAQLDAGIFAIFVTHYSPSEVVRLATRIQQTIERTSFQTACGELPVTLSAGIAYWNPSMNTDTFITAAKYQFSNARNKGSNGLCYRN